MARGAEVVTSVFQGFGQTNLTSYITNNDNAIYNSATFDLVGTYVLESNEDLEDGMGWQEAASWVMPGVALPGERLSEEWREPRVPGGRRFYRLRWELP